MDKIDYNKLANSELKLILTTLENEYETLKNKISNDLARMEFLDAKYAEVRNVLNKRTKGKIL